MTNQQPSQLGKTATEYVHQSLPPPASAIEADTTCFHSDYIVQVSSQRSNTFPRRAARRASSSFLRHSASQSSSLWNPANSSAVSNLPSTELLDNPQEPSAVPSHAGQLTDACKPSLNDLGLAYRNGLNLQSHSSLLVEISQSGSSPISPNKLSTPAQHSPVPTRAERSLTALPTPPTMTPPASSHSDTPSKRPPTPAKDLEYGIPNPPAPPQSQSRTPSGHSRPASSINSDLPWNPAHPCYPHPNPHIPLASPLRNATRIIRIPRDWMIVGDLAPTFSNTYPEVLEPWVSEADFRTLIKEINDGLVTAFSPYGWRAWVDAALGLATGWVWEDLGFAAVKSQVRKVEQLIEDWNGGRRNILEKDEDQELVRAIPLRRTGYLCLDIQIPDPHVGMVEEDEGNTEGDQSMTDGEERRQQEGKT